GGCCKSPLSLRDAYRDVSARATHGAVAERVRERESIRGKLLILDTLIPAFSRGEKELQSLATPGGTR
ncbi:MAG: hypothetical protein WBM52_15665, partial [Thiogranum sp.]